MHELEILTIGHSEAQGKSLPFPPALPSGKDAPLSPPLQQQPAPPAGASLQQMLYAYMEQQQQQQALNTAALAAYLLSLNQQLPGSAVAPLQPTWQQPALYNNATAAPWQLQAGPPGLLGNTQFAGFDALAAAATSAAPFSQPLSSSWLEQQQPRSQALEMAATEQQLHSLLQGYQFPVGGFGNVSSSSSMQASACSGPMPLSSDFSGSYSSLMSAATGNAAALQAAAAPMPLDISLASLSLKDRSNNGSLASSSSGSPSRASSLLHGSFCSLSSGGGSGSWGAGAAAAAAIAAAAAASAGSSVDVSAQQVLDDDDTPVVHNHFCRQEISLALNAAVTVLLNTLRSLQYAGENPYPKQHRLYVCGLRESCKAIKSGKARAVLLAPDIQLNKLGKPDRVLDGRMNEIILSSQLPRPGCARVPVVFALSRKKIGQVFGSKKRMSAIALLDVSGVEELFGMVLQLAEEGRQRWAEMQNLSFTSMQP